MKPQVQPAPGSCGRRALAAALALAFARPTQATPPAFTIQGSTTFDSELLQAHADRVAAMAQVSLKVVPNKSNLGLLALLDAAADLAMTSAPLASLLPPIRQARPAAPIDTLTEFPIAQTRAVLIVHPTNPVRTASEETLRAIFSGAVVNWKELGGPDKPIRVVAAREGGGVITTMETHILGPGRQLAAPDQVRVRTGPQIVRIVEQEPGALGITDSRLATGRTVAELQTTRPVEQTLFLVSLGEPTAQARAVIDACRQLAVTAAQ